MKFTVRRENGSNKKFNKITASRENKKIEKHSACTFDRDSGIESISKYLGTSEHSTPLKLPLWGRGVWYFCFCGFGHFIVRFLSRKTFFGFGSVFASVFVLCCSRFPVLGKNKIGFSDLFLDASSVFFRLLFGKYAPQWAQPRIRLLSDFACGLSFEWNLFRCCGFRLLFFYGFAAFTIPLCPPPLLICSDEVWKQVKPWSRFDAWTRQKCTSALL